MTAKVFLVGAARAVHVVCPEQWLREDSACSYGQQGIASLAGLESGRSRLEAQGQGDLGKRPATGLTGVERRESAKCTG